MKKVKSSVRRMGFSLVEMLVVIGILAILIAALLPMLGGSRDSALNAQCKNNMKNLALGAIAYAEGRSENDGHFPSAGYYRSLGGRIAGAGRRRSGSGVSYYPHPSWISNKSVLAKDLNETRASLIIGDVAHFSDPDDDSRRFAITNGAIWASSGKSYEIYRCPVHARTYADANSGHLPGWSYVMNQEFGFNRDGKGQWGFFGAVLGHSITVSTETSGLRGEKKQASRSPDKVLMFAEVQGVDIDDTRHGIKLQALVSGSNNKTDAVLEYTQEEIGFNHKLGKFKYGGNVAFADGHVDTIVLPTSMSRKDLTRYLCQGYDVPHDGRSYTPNNDDK